MNLTGGWSNARGRGAVAARSVAAVLVIASTLIVAAVVAPKQASATSPGTPGTPQAPTSLYTEDFQNRPGPSPIVNLAGYTGASGQTYTADPQWLLGCNGWIASANEATNAAAPSADCTSSTIWNRAQQLAESLGLFNGETAAVARDNYANSDYTAGTPNAAGLVEFQTATNIPLVTSNRFLTFSVDVAAVNCAVSAPLLQFSLVNSAGTATPAGTQINGCSGGTNVGVPAQGGVGALTAVVGSHTANGALLITGPSVGIKMVNNNGSGNGNDHAIDNIQVLDVTPQLDKSFSPANVNVGGKSTLTITVTNRGAAPVSGATLADPATAGLTKTGVACASAPGVCSSNPSLAQLEAGLALPTLAPGDVYRIDVTAKVTAPVGTTVVNTATVVPPGGGSGSAVSATDSDRSVAESTTSTTTTTVPTAASSPEPTNPAPPTTSEGPLAFTGGNAAPYLYLGVGAILLGVALLLGDRRRAGRRRR